MYVTQYRASCKISQERIADLMMWDVTGIGRYTLTDTEVQEGGQRELVVVRSITGLPSGLLA